jgi:hypothetical protein
VIPKRRFLSKVLQCDSVAEIMAKVVAKDKSSTILNKLDEKLPVRGFK